MGTELQAHAPTWEPEDDDLEVFDDSEDALVVGETEEHFAKQCSSSAKDFAAEHEQLRTQHDKVAVHIDNVSFNSRKLLASTAIAAPVDIVWALMKDYEHLDTFIPSLVENRCLERRPLGCLLYQVGAQDIALGIKFSAKTTLECIEYEQGISEDLCTHGLEELTELFPWPDGGLPSTAARDISFRQVHGDFHVFHGLWRMQSGLEGETSCLMTYSLFVQPKPWLPVRLIQGRIVSGIVDNLKAIAKHAEEVYSTQLA
jgi:ribosome-associated toxin RatA of RatAB toxin-antitoxin module